jgi:quinoprotein glucose dehydrogenase
VSIALRLYAILLAICSIPLIFGGGDLIALRGTVYYLVAGVLLATAAVLLWRRSRWGLWVYCILILITLGWTLWETGLDQWAMIPRLAFLSLLGLWLLLPYPRRHLSGGPKVHPNLLRAMPFALAASVGVPTLAAIVIGSAGDYAETAVRAEALDAPANADWPAYGGTAAGTRFSPLTQINTSNVKKLRVAWVYHFNDVIKQTLEVTPLKIDDSLYACSSSNVVVSLDAETGRERWKFDPKIDPTEKPFPLCRGVAYFRATGMVGDCVERIYTNTIDARLIALDARTGRRCRDFGTNGEVSLLAGLGEVINGYYFPTSAPTIVRGKLVVGARVYDGQFWNEPSGVIRAFDAITGKLTWAFDVGRPDRLNEPGSGESYTRSTPNSWAPMSSDEELGLVYVPTGNPTGSDFYGGVRRPFDEKYGSAVIAIDAETGRERWTFQTTHHDLWDYDVSSQPTLVDFPTVNGIVKALIQPTKRGEIFILNRETGAPLDGVIERAVPQTGAAPGDPIAPTQPYPIGMPSIAGPRLSEAGMWGLTPFDQLWCRIKFREARYEGPHTPPGLSWSIQYPGTIGGTNWGGASVDTDRDIMVLSTTRVATRVRLISRGEADALAKPLGKGGTISELGGVQPQAGTPYGAYIPAFLSPLEVPCQQPPWGLLYAIDLKSRKILWSRNFGTGRDSGPFNIRSLLAIPTGVPNAGGSLLTRSGLTFVGATVEREFRAIDTTTGRTVWHNTLPAAGNASPMTYLGSRTGQQFVVIATGGHLMLNAKGGDSLIAYALPQ